MTVPNETYRNVYTAAGTAGELFPVTFFFFASSDLRVLANGVLQVLGTNYSVQGGGGSAGSITWNGTPTAGATVTITRVQPATQVSDYQENSSFPAESHEDALDKAAMVDQSSIRLASDMGDRWDAQGQRIASVADPTTAQDAATKAYVDSKGTFPASLPDITVPDVGRYLQAIDDIPDTVAWMAPREVPSPAGGDVGEVLTATGAGTFAWAPAPGAGAIAVPFNYILNGDFQVSQRAGDGGTHISSSTYPNNDDSYVLDRWVLLSNGNNVVSVGHEMTTVPDGAARALRATVVTANLKFGFLTILENRLVRRLLRNGITSTCSIRFKYRTNTGAVISNIRVGVLAWTGAVDAPTSDVVLAWNAAGVDPTLTANWVYENVPANIPVTVDAFGETVIQGISLNTAGTNNLAVFIWCDDTNAAVNDILFLAEVQLEAGSISNVFVPADPAAALAACERYFETSYQTAVGTISLLGQQMIRAGAALGVGSPLIASSLRTRKRATPAMSIFSPDTGAIGNVRNVNDGVDRAVVTANVGQCGYQINCNVASAFDGPPTFGGEQAAWHYAADAEL